jgi:uncharacterized protein YqjF (DUF2071 family)
VITKLVDCTIERRLLVNYRIDPELVTAQLPEPFRPHIRSGWAVGGVCFIRLRNLRPPHLPGTIGLTTENVAHRFAVEWDDSEGTHTGVYVPRRDTGSRFASFAGGRLFPGDYRLADFDIEDAGSQISIDVTSRDSVTQLSVRAHRVEVLGGALFGSVGEAIDFFRHGSLSYSPGSKPGVQDGVGLDCPNWAAEPVSVDKMTSSLFDDSSAFPAGACTLDSGLIMRELPVRWIDQGRLVAHTYSQIGAV